MVGLIGWLIYGMKAFIFWMSDMDKLDGSTGTETAENRPL
jgi:hypothetical protein